MSVTFEQLVAPVRGIGVDALKEWRWLVPVTSQPLLLTAMGDLFVQSPDGSVGFLDTVDGKHSQVSDSYERWKVDLQEAEKIETWFLPGFVEKLLSAVVFLNEGEVYSPTIPPILGGEWRVENFTPTPWLAHLHVLGQIHRQVKDLPEGTPITGFNVEWT